MSFTPLGASRMFLPNESSHSGGRARGPSRATRSHPNRGAAAYAWSYEHVLFPTWQQLVHGRPTTNQLASLEASQWLPREAIDELVLDDLRALLAHAGANVPYYRDLFAEVRFVPAEVRSVKDLERLPILTREIIHERYDDLLDPAHRGTNIRKGTSGTTGRPLKFEYCNDSESWRQAVRIRGYGWAGYRLGLPTLHYWAQPPTVPHGINAAKINLDRALRRETYVDAIRQEPEEMRHAVDVVRRVRPHVIVGYTQATALFARFINENGLRDWDDIPVICGAEAVLSSDRDALVRAFGSGIFETYGSRETMLIGAECAAHEGMHVSEENIVAEVVQNGVAVAPGEPGDVLVTDLHNYGMPLIRYQNGDVATMSGSASCECGRALKKIERVEGRRADTLHDANGAPVPGMLFIALFARKTDFVRQFQVAQKKSGEVVLKVVPGPEFSQTELDGVVRRFDGYLHGAPLAVELVDTIAPSSSGKRRPIVVEH